MTPLVAIGSLLFALAVGYTGWVTTVVLRSSVLENRQKVMQTAIAWLIPVLGAVLVHLINRAQERGPTAAQANGVVPQIDQGVSPADFMSPDQ